MLTWLKTRFSQLTSGGPAPAAAEVSDPEKGVKMLTSSVVSIHSPSEGAPIQGPGTTRAERRAKLRKLKPRPVGVLWGHLLRRLEEEEAASPSPRGFVWRAGLTPEEGQILCDLANNHGFVASSSKGEVTVLIHLPRRFGDAGPVQREVAKMLQTSLPEGDWMGDPEQLLLLARKPPPQSVAMATFRRGVMTSLLMIHVGDGTPGKEKMESLFFREQELTTLAEREHAVLKMALLWQSLESRS